MRQSHPRRTLGKRRVDLPPQASCGSAGISPVPGGRLFQTHFLCNGMCRCSDYYVGTAGLAKRTLPIRADKAALDAFGKGGLDFDGFLSKVSVLASGHSVGPTGGPSTFAAYKSPGAGVGGAALQAPPESGVKNFSKNFNFSC